MKKKSYLALPRIFSYALGLILAWESLGFSVTVITATKAELSAFLDGLEAKIAYSEDRSQLVYLDLTADTLELQRPATAIPAQVPTISPDGMWVAYSDKSDGFFNGRGYIQKLTPDAAGQQAMPGASVVMPRWWVNPWTGDTTITYVDRSRNNDIIYCTAKGIQASIDDPVNNPLCVDKEVGDIKINPWEDENYLYGQVFKDGSLISPPVELARGPWEAGISRDGQYTGAGQGTGAYFRNMGRNSRTRVFLPPENGFDEEIQICNVSITPGMEVTDELMAVDFGSGGRTSSITGSVYSQHQVIYIINSEDSVTNWIASPHPDERMDNPDWSTHPEFAITNVRKTDGSSGLYAIYLINLEAKTFLKVIESDDKDLCHPSLWVLYDSPRLPFQIVEPALTPEPSDLISHLYTGAMQVLDIPFLPGGTINVPVGVIYNIELFDVFGRSIVPYRRSFVSLESGYYFFRVSYKDRYPYLRKFCL